MKHLILFVIICLPGNFLSARQKMNSVANGGAVIKYNNVRFTVLTPGVIRLEWDSTGKFADQASFVAINRNLPVPKFSKKENNQSIQIITERLTLTYKKGSEKLSDKNLTIVVKTSGTTFTWKPGIKNTQNLKGTARTLDRYDGDINWDNKKVISLGEGLISKDGWYVIDDSKNFLFDNSDWPWVQTREHVNGQDWYFFGYGKDYKTALYDYTQIAGKIPLPPKFAFGYWWSRYWNYSDKELRELVNNFEHYKVPIDVLVIDMDWHTIEGLNWKKIPYPGKVDEFGQSLGWTGYTWNKALFPDPSKFMDWTNKQNLKTTLNLHPASGIRENEEKYQEFAQAMNFDTTGRKNIPFESTDKKYMENLFKIILHPMEKMGVDFWWLDWQQWRYSKKIAGLDNTWWLNYCFFSDMERRGEKRPLLYHRWGGLGNHRYQIGFSGDSFISWNSLDFQPYFTSTASNVLYGYWSHDIGGHKFADDLPADKQKIDPEMFTRWMQYGALSPVFRTHSSKDARIIKELWNFPAEYSQVIYEAICMRYELAPYIYTMARKAYDTGISLCRPMYYDYPEKQEAYDFKNEYMFGDDILVAPVTSPAQNYFSTVKVWLPQGTDWYEVFTGTLLKGGQILERKFLLNQYPLYVKAGAIVLMYPWIKNLQKAEEDLIVRIFPGENYETKLYEDAGDDNEYKNGAFTYTSFKTERKADGSLKLTISPREGSFSGMIKERNLEVQLYGEIVPGSVMVNGKELPYSLESKNDHWNYSGKNLMVRIYLPEKNCNDKLELQVNFPARESDINGMIGKMTRLNQSTSILKSSWDDVSELPSVISITNQADIEIEYQPKNFNKIVNEFNRNYLLIPDIIKTTHVDSLIMKKCSQYLLE